MTATLCRVHLGSALSFPRPMIDPSGRPERGFRFDRQMKVKSVLAVFAGDRGEMGSRSVGWRVVTSSGSVTTDVLSEVRAASDLTMEAGTARVTYDLELGSVGLSLLADLFNPANADPPGRKGARAVWSVVGGGLKAAEKGLLNLANGCSEGVIDFSCGDTLLIRRMLGREYQSYIGATGITMRRTGDGTWRTKTRSSSDAPAAYSPIWLVELPRGATSAKDLGRELVDGASCLRAQATCDLAQATSLSAHVTDARPSPGGTTGDLRIEAWIDTSGRLRRIRTKLMTVEPHQFMTTPPNGRLELNLSDFGGPPPLVPPTPTS
jgi:hypothetical protein